MYSRLTPITILITVLCYFAILFGISFIASRHADNASFFSGGKQQRWYLVALSTIGAAMSGVTFVSVPGMVANDGFAYMQMVAGFTVGQLIIAFVLIPLYYKLNVTSIYEYLDQRFGLFSHKTGAIFFFISKILGAAVRLLVVCVVLQLLVFTPLGIGFGWNVLFSMLLVWVYTFRGGVKTLVWTDVLKTTCLLLSVGFSVYFIGKNLGSDFDIHLLLPTSHSGNEAYGNMARWWYFDDINDKRYFWKEFFAGIMLVVATTGLDQDMMQRTLTCKDHKESQKNVIVGATMQIIVIWMFLVLGLMLYIYADKNSIDLPQRGDEVFGYLATGGYFPIIVGILFIIGLISAAYSAAGSALTALTTAFTIDILDADKKHDAQSVTRIRKISHAIIAVSMGILIWIIYTLNNDSLINTVYLLASYTYGPLLGLFTFGIFSKRQPRDKWVPIIAVLAPIICYILDINSQTLFNGYQFGHERLIYNAALSIIGLYIASIHNKKANTI